MKKNLRLVFFILSILLVFMTSCDEPVLIPKPRGFPKVEFPEKGYQTFTQNYCDFTFEYPQYAQVIQDTIFFGEQVKHPCWFDVFVPEFDARIHCSYSPLGKDFTLDKLKEDAFDMVQKHNIKAKYIEEIQIQNQHGASGFMFNLDGEVASPFQFYLTDSTQHFLRGSLYFNTQARPDSLAPIIKFVKKDAEHLISTLKWND